ncbi:hypothetical protein SEVIR_6G207300v4 [Setaria viridis]|uniref:Uncharacterized protein n=1 Tax=Setaria viridis TaxID=4556 RepID=A0A4U6U5U5_SETVI|nr:hypothetical protein SEVIR_6G207300v2 [Setaria viridis]
MSFKVSRVILCPFLFFPFPFSLLSSPRRTSSTARNPPPRQPPPVLSPPAGSPEELPQSRTGAARRKISSGRPPELLAPPPVGVPRGAARREAPAASRPSCLRRRPSEILAGPPAGAARAVACGAPGFLSAPPSSSPVPPPRASFLRRAAGLELPRGQRRRRITPWMRAARFRGTGRPANIRSGTFGSDV